MRNVQIGERSAMLYDAFSSDIHEDSMPVHTPPLPNRYVQLIFQAAPIALTRSAQVRRARSVV